jgi:hypothetical protein
MAAVNTASAVFNATYYKAEAAFVNLDADRPAENSDREKRSGFRELERERCFHSG